MSALRRPDALHHGWPLAGLSVAVLAAHLAVGAWVADAALGLGAAGGSTIRRMDVAFVQELAPTAVAEATAGVPAARAMNAVVPHPPARPASAAKGKDSAPAATRTGLTADVVPPPALPEAPPAPAPDPALEPVSPPADLPARLAEADVATPVPTPGRDGEEAPPPPVATSASAAAGAGPGIPFEWPPSTRLSYSLVGDYRGPVHGTARVEWIRRGDRYQVHLEVSVGPLVSRRMSSEGRLGEHGLEPERYEEVTEGLMRSARRQSVRFEPERIVLANGQSVARPPGVQDTASQFVQMTWLFITRRQRLALGETLEMPLALPRIVDRWLYDVQAEEVLDTPAGPLKTFHMKPRRAQPRPGELAVESWFAPSLQFLPARMVIRQDEQTFVDLTIDRLPQQALSPPGR